MNCNEGQQLDYLNIAKGIGIILVVLGHSLSAISDELTSMAEFVRTIIYLVHMPLFFTIAGFLFEKNKGNYRKKGIKKYAKSKFFTFMIPYFTFSIVITIVAILCEHINALHFIAAKLRLAGISFSAVIKGTFLYINPLDDHLWFSYVMFAVLILSFVLAEISEQKVLIFFYVMYIITFFVDLPEILWKVMRYMLIFQSGRVIYKRKKDFLNVKVLTLFIVFVASTTLYLFLKNEKIGFMGAFKPIAEVSSSILIIRFSMWLENMKLSKKLIYIGKNSYAIYLMHQPYIVPVIMLLISGGLVKNVIASIVAVFLGVAIPIVIEKQIVSKSKFLSIAVLGGHK